MGRFGGTFGPLHFGEIWCWGMGIRDILGTHLDMLEKLCVGRGTLQVHMGHFGHAFCHLEKCGVGGEAHATFWKHIAHLGKFGVGGWGTWDILGAHAWGTHLEKCGV